MTEHWVVADERPFDDELAASAAASQASLGELLGRLRSVRFREIPEPADEGSIEPWVAP